MKASELRIGNYVQEENNAILELSSIGELCNIKRLSAAYHIDELSPIPLTEEWLLKFGFNAEQSEDQDGPLVFWDRSGNYHRFWIEKRVANPFYYIAEQPVDIQYVHQLQNLYFSLTGEELEVK